MWTGNTDVITNQTPRNYMFGEKVFILDEITSEMNQISSIASDEFNMDEYMNELSNMSF